MVSPTEAGGLDVAAAALQPPSTPAGLFTPVPQVQDPLSTLAAAADADEANDDTPEHAEPDDYKHVGIWGFDF